MGRGRAQKTIDLLAVARDVLEEIQPASVRAVCYRLFALGEIAEMSRQETARVSRLLTQGREDGDIPWEWIVDETRAPEYVPSFKNPQHFMKVVKRGYRRDRWQDQLTRVEVWSEKGTVRGTLAPVLDEFGVTFRVFHGYASATAVKEAADVSKHDDKRMTALYVGDWDPSGAHMSEVDLPSRLAKYGGDVDLQRIALVNSDTYEGKLSYFPATSKRNDARWLWWQAQKFGPRCWELDAMSPPVLRERVRQAILACIDEVVWHGSGIAQDAEEESLVAYFDRYPIKQS